MKNKGRDVRALLPHLRERVGKDFARADLARESGVSDSHLSRLESGERGLSEEVAKRLAPALKLTPQALYAMAGFEAVEPGSLAVPTADEARLRLRQALIDMGVSERDRNALADLAERLAGLNDETSQAAQ